MTGKSPSSLRTLAAASVIVPAVWIALNHSRPFAYGDVDFLYWVEALAPRAGEVPPQHVNCRFYGETLGDLWAHSPPAWPLLLAGLRRIGVDTAFACRWLELPFAALFLFSCCLLAARVGVPEWTAFWLAATSPLFLLTSVTVMPDLPGLGLATLGIALWAGEGGGGRLAGAVCMVLSGQLKQTFLPLFGLLLLPGPSGRWPRPRYLLVAVAAFLLACRYPQVEPAAATAGTPAEHVSWLISFWWEKPLLLPKFAYMLAVFAATVAFPAVWILADEPGRARRNRWLAGTAVVAVLFMIGAWKFVRLPEGSVAPVPPGWEGPWFYAAIALALGWSFSSLPAAARSYRGRWVLMWLALAAAGYELGANFPRCRFLLGLLPPIVLLVAPAMARGRLALAVTVAGNLWLSVSLAHSDIRLGGFFRESAARAADIAAARELPLVTIGQEGLRREIENNGGRVLERADEPLPAGAVLVVPDSVSQLPFPPMLRARSSAIQTWTGAPSKWQDRLLVARSVAYRRYSAAFAGGHCWLPYAITRDSLEGITVFLIPPSRRGTKR